MNEDEDVESPVVSIVRMGGPPAVAIMFTELEQQEFLNAARTWFSNRSMSFLLDLPTAQSLATRLRLAVDGELAEIGIREALGAGKPEEM